MDKASSYVVKYISKEIGSVPFKSRYWVSRGLSRAKRLATYYFPEYCDYSRQLGEYNKYMLSVAAVTKSHHVMHQESYLPVRNRAKKATESQRLVVITTYINGCNHTPSEIIDHLSTVYDSTPHYVIFRSDALASPEEVASSRIQLNLIHNYLTATKLQKECIDLAEAERLGTLEWIDFQPFIELSKDSPLNKCFDSPKCKIPLIPYSQLSFSDFYSKKSLPKRRLNNHD